MGGFVGFVVVLIIIISVVQKAKNVARQQQTEVHHSSEEIDARNRRLMELRRMQEQNGNVPYPAPHVAPHAPTVHPQAENPDCDAHRRPYSTEGSTVRAHAYTAEDTNCNAHALPASSEGESNEIRLDRLRRQKEEREAHDAFLNRYDAVDKENIKEAHIRMPRYTKTSIPLTGNDILQGIVYSEILNPPISRRRKSM